MVSFGQLDIPDEVVQAHHDGDLVVFVGAGASAGAPSSLPLFGGLAAQIAAETGIAMGEGEPFDVYLGRADESANVHARVAEIIGNPTSRPNGTHEAIAALARTAGACRIVSTNYDRHVSAALRDAGVVAEEWSAPAMPVGGEFQGLVYLHGTLGKPASRLVVTDEDFGKAYLRDGWATRFLDEMFREYKTLFVGYSHEDLIMTYLGRGLRADSRRWILTDNPDSDLYKRLRVTPIPFGPGAFTDLEHGLARWAANAGMGLLDHRSQLAELLRLQPSELRPEERSYMEATFTDAVRTQVFVDVCATALVPGNAEAWLGWAATQLEFRTLLDDHSSQSDAARRLAFWFAEQFVVNGERTEAAMRVVRDAKGPIHPALWSDIALSFFRREQPRESWANQWLLLLLRDAPVNAPRDLLEYLLGQSAYPQDHDLIVAMLNHLLRPRPELRVAFGATGTRVEVSFPHDAHELDRAIAQVVTPNIADLAPALMALVEQHLRSAHHILASAGASSARFDPLSFGRSAVESHDQDQFRDPVDPLLDLARDSLDSLLRTQPEWAAATIDRWIASPVQLLRRLAVHGMTGREDLTADEKLAWAIDSQLLWDFHCQHEVFDLIATVLDPVSDQAVDSLIGLALEGPVPDPGDTREDADYHRQYRIYNVIVWLFKNAPQRSAVSQAMREQQDAHPDFGPREHPDLHVSMTTGFETPQPPSLDADDVHQAIVSDVGRAVAMLLELDERTGWPGSTWSRPSANTLSAAVAKYPLDGIAVLTEDPDDAHEFRQTVLAAWRETSSSAEHIATIIAAISAWDLPPFAADIASFFAHSANEVKLALQASDRARALARDLWNALDPGGDSALLNPHNILERAYNSAAGHLAEYWVEVFVQEWRETEATWSEIPAGIRDDLQSSIGSSEETGKQSLARAIYLSRLHLFWSADRPWAETWLLPLLNWTQSPQAAALLWPAYLMGGRWNDQLLAAGLLEQYLVATSVLASDDPNVRQALAGHMAAISIQSTLDLSAANWLVQLTSGSDEELRAEWFDALSDLLREGIGDPEAEWARWLSGYVNERAKGIPLSLTEREASALTEIVIQLGPSFVDAVTLVERTPASLNHDRYLVHRLETDKAASHPEAAARLVIHLLKNTQPGQFYDNRGLKRIFEAVRPIIEPQISAAYKEAVAKIGFTDALEW
jgi:hypothetical protein